MAIIFEQEFVNNHKTEEIIAWSVLELGRAKLELSSNPDSLVAYGRYSAQVEQVYQVLQALNKKLAPQLQVVS